LTCSPQIDIACLENPKPGEGYAEVQAGTSVQVQWTAWADSHKGPILDYLAPCPNDNCVSTSASALRFTKIGETGLMGAGANGKHAFATEYLAKHNNTWEVKIPASLKSGNYVLRNEIIALHNAGTVNGAQNYPQCFNLKVTGGGSASLPPGVSAQQIYRPNTPGIVFNVYGAFQTYPIPGPPLWKAGDAAAALGTNR